jgi:hypothetical protein
MNTKPVPHMTADDLEALVRKAVRDELNAAGLRLHDPAHQDEARADFIFLRKMRTSFDGAASKIGYTILLSIAGGVIWLITQGANVWRGG